GRERARSCPQLPLADASARTSLSDIGLMNAELRSDDARTRTVAPHANHVAALRFGEAMRPLPMRHGPMALAGAVNPRMPHTGSPGARIESPAGMMVRHRPGVDRRGTGESL